MIQIKIGIFSSSKIYHKKILILKKLENLFTLHLNYKKEIKMKSLLVPDFLLKHYIFFTVNDIVEIIFFSTLFYYCTCWLKRDTNNKLLAPFYGYFATLMSAHLFQLPTISYFLFLFSPAAVMLFIIYHQENLQRNFIAQRTITPIKKNADSHWIELLFGSFIESLNVNKKLICIIEQDAALAPLLTAPFTLDVPIQRELISALLQTPLYNSSKMIWVTAKGNIISTNATWKIILPNATSHDWHHTALHASSKTDAIILMAMHGTKEFNIIYQGQIIEELNSTQAIGVIKRIFSKVDGSAFAKATADTVDTRHYSSTSAINRKTNRQSR